MSANLTWCTIGSPVPNAGYMSCYGNYMYFPNSASNRVSRIDLSSAAISTFISTNLNFPNSSLVFGKYLYIGCQNGNYIAKYDLSNGSVININWVNIRAPISMATDGKYMYVDYSNNNIAKIDFSGNVDLNWLINVTTTGYSNILKQLAISGNYMYVGTDTGGTGPQFYQIDLNTKIYTNKTSILPSSRLPAGTAVYGNYLYTSYYNNTTNIIISQFKLPELTLVTNNYGNLSGVSGSSSLFGIFPYKNNLYVFQQNGSKIWKIPLTSTPPNGGGIVCSDISGLSYSLYFNNNYNYINLSSMIYGYTN